MRHQKSPSQPVYYLRSSVMGGAVLTELKQDGMRLRAYAHAAGEILAKYENNAVEYPTP